MNAEVVCVQLPGCLGLGLLLAFFVAGALSKVEFIPIDISHHQL
jgi:hypothetical protein